MGKPLKPIQARKRFGQNFLQDCHVISQICQHIAPRPDDHIIEIGPGLGALTIELFKHVSHLNVIELDRDLIPRLEVNCDGLGKLIVHQADALCFDFNTLSGDQKMRIVGNLPYNISTPLLFHLLNYLPKIKDMYFMLQLEVVERMAAKPGTPAYGRLSVMVQYACEVENLFRVPPEAFEPAPSVMSAIVCLKPHKEILHPANDFSLFSDLVRAAFGMRRKTIRNSMAKHIAPDDLAALGFDLKLRPENLSVSDFVKIANAICDL